MLKTSTNQGLICLSRSGKGEAVLLKKQIMNKQNNMDGTMYETPQVEIIEVAVEKGYAQSGEDYSIEGQASDTNEEYEFGW